ncbi:MAG: hypothetical protein ACKO2G_05735 [Verrucomicrobiales bacterium]
MAQKLAEPAAPAPQPVTYLLGTGVTAPGALMYRAPVAGQFLAPMVPSSQAKTVSAVAVAIPAETLPTPTAGASSLTCIQLAARVEVEIGKAPSEVLNIVRRAMVDNDACACDVVKAAIKASKADDTLTGLIVETAVKTRPARFKEIVECAILAKPTARAQVRAALERVFGTKGSAKGRKIVVAKAESAMPRTVVKEIPEIFFPPLFTGNPPPRDGDKENDKDKDKDGGGDGGGATPTNPVFDFGLQSGGTSFDDSGFAFDF